MTNVVLHIDTSISEEVSITLVTGSETYSKRQNPKGQRTQALLPLIEEILKENALQLSQITELSVVTGPGSFTGIRVGLAVANMLSSLLHVPINGKKALATPTYS